MTRVPGTEPDRPGGVRIAPEVSALVLEEGFRAAPEESCGLLLGRHDPPIVRVSTAVPCENTAPEALRNERFEIDPRRVIEVERSLRGSADAVVGFYHSHPASDAIPSEVDRPFMELWPEMIWLIVGHARERRRAVLRVWGAPKGEQGAPEEMAIQIPD